ncbi:hypothetical protein C4561_01610 [candidate division WWE3 bacterium]|uniref:Uncharacterized protein n=1 Tax=candidate division WWE3 bacterium TaxID=2053526 RepID=A0A3A4ZM51_UNCKA|nr:MAG: hypothetical protein C4561_01610 [candidate division WWE3 bacterium]
MSISSIANQSYLDYFIKVYIQDDNSKWIDFTDRTSYIGFRGVDRVMNLQSVKYTVEKEFGLLQTTTQRITFDNSDNFFSKPFPTTLKTTDSNTASFLKTSNYNHSVLFKHKLKVTACFYDKSAGIGLATITSHQQVTPLFEFTLGTFILDEFSLDFSSRTITFAVKGLEAPLMKVDASKIKDGNSWYQNRPVSFLISELLKLYYMDSDGQLPDTYSIERNLSTPTIDGSLILSHFGRPPEWDGSRWRNDGLYTRAICWADLSISGTRGRLYLGCDDELWEWNPDTDEYTLIDDSTIYALNPNAKIKKIIVGSSQQLYIVAWQDESDYSKNTFTDFNASRPCYILIYNGSTLTYLTTTEIWSCIYLVHWSNVSAGGVGAGIGQIYSGTCGENKTVPFPQAVYYLEFDPSVSLNVIGTSPTAGIWDNLSTILTPIYKPDTGYVGVAKYYVPEKTIGLWHFDSIFTTKGRLMWSYGVPYQVVRSSQGGVEKLFMFEHLGVSYSGATPTEIFYLKRVLMSTGATTTWGIGTDFVPVCLWKKSLTSNYVMMSVMSFDVAGTGDANRNNNVILRFDETTGVITNIGNFTSVVSGDDLYWTLFEVCELGTSGFAVASCYNRKTRVFQLLWVSNSEFFGYLFNSSVIATSLNQYKQLHYDSASNKVYCYEVNAGRVVSVNISGVMTIEASGSSAVEGDYNILSSLTSRTDVSSSAPVIYGISSPTYPPETQDTYPNGKFYLFQLANEITDRIELADFSDKKSWDAIKLLTQASNSIAFFDENGNFVLKKRLVSSGTADFSIGNQGGSVENVIDVKVTSGETEIFNYCAIEPGRVTYELPNEDAITLVARNDNEYGDGVSEVPFVPYDIDQRDALTKVVRAVCVVGGTTTDGLSRFKYAITNEKISAFLTQDAGVADVTYYLSSVFGGDDVASGVNVGDFASVIHPTSGAELIRTITTVSLLNNTITLASTFGVALNRKTEISILKAFQTASNTKSSWSDEGVAYLTANLTATVATVNSLDGLSVGTVVKFKSGTTYSSEYRITAVNKLLNQFTIDSAVPSTISSGAVVLAWYSPIDNVAYPSQLEIGGSRVFLQFRTPEGGTAESDFTKTFKPGDRITIDCPGLQLNSDSTSKQVAVNVTSESKYQRLEFPTISNSFIHAVLAKEFARYIVNYYKDPTYSIELTIPLAPELKLVNNSGELVRIDVYLPEVFPFSEGGIQQCHVRGIEHNLSNRTTRLSLKAVEAY